MRKTISTLLMALAIASAAGPASAQQPVKGQDAIAIVQGGQIRASSSQGIQGFLLLIEYRGANFACVITAVGQVQTCYPLRW